METMESSQENVIGEIRHLLNCPVCYQQYDRPKRLRCEHVFCSPCLEKIIRDGVIKCPECRLVTTPSTPTVSSLSTCIIIQRFLDGLSNNNCNEDDDITNGNNYMLEGAVCDLETPTTSVNKLKNAIHVNYQPAIDHLKEKKRNIEENLNSVRNSINYFTHELIKGIQVRRSRLMEEVDLYESRWLKPLECQIDGLEMEVHEQVSLVSFREDDCEQTDETFCELNMRLAHELSDVMNAFECGSLSLSDTGALQRVLDDVSNLGNVSEDYNPDLTYAGEDIGIEITPVLNQQSSLNCNFGPRGMCIRDEVLMVVDSSNRSCYEVNQDVVRKFRLTNDERPNASFIDVTTINQGKTLIFSDFSSPVLKMFDREFNEHQPIDLQIGSTSPLVPTPFSLMSDRRGFIFITDKRNRVVQVREESGKLVREFSCHGIPGYIAVWNDMLVVSDAGSKCCYIYSVDGRLLSTIDQQAGVNFKMPTGVAFHEKGFIFVADYLKKCLFSLSISGRQILSEIDLSNYKINPEGITVHKNSVYISDRLNRNIVKIKLTNFPPSVPES